MDQWIDGCVVDRTARVWSLDGSSVLNEVKRKEKRGAIRLDRCSLFMDGSK